MKIFEWVKFRWDVEKLGATGLEVPKNYTIRPAEKSDRDTVWKVIHTAFMLDPDWARNIHDIMEDMEESFDIAFDGREIDCVVLLHGQRIIGASLLNRGTGMDNHLVSGPCISMEYRSRGFGTLLLHGSLEYLRENGVKEVFGITRKNGPAAKYVYPKFGGTEVIVPIEISA